MRRMCQERRTALWKAIRVPVLMVGGCLLFSLAMNLLLVPMELYNGGFLGLAQLLQDLLRWLSVDPEGIDVAGILNFCLNVPLFFLSYRSIGRRFFGRTLWAVLCYTVFLTVIPSPQTPLLQDRLTGCLVGGVLAGIGVGMTLRAGGCGGGEEILGVYLSQKNPKITVGRVSIALNLLVYGCCLIRFQVETVIYSLLYSVVTNLTLDRVHLQGGEQKLLVISSDSKLGQVVQRTAARDVTHWTGTNGSDAPVYITMVLVSKGEAKALRKAIPQLDPQALIMTEGADVWDTEKGRLP